ncbi:MAG: serine/threonine-protein kinase [Chlamydiales bacterium]|nr:serine/threonine-protein kinase [Chlamydiales bacterium]
MLPTLYPFTALETVKTYQALPNSGANEEDAAYITSQFTIRKAQRMAVAAYRFATSHTWEGEAISTRLEHGVVIVSTKEGKNLFVSTRDKIASSGVEGWSIKKIAMIKLDVNGRVVRSKGSVQVAVKLSKLYNEQTNKHDIIARRLSTMQKFEASPYFPTNYGYVFREGKKGRKITLFQEMAIMDLLNFNNRCHSITDFSKLQKLHFCKTMLGAIRTFENAKFVHRDMKLDNVLVFYNDDPKAKTRYIFKVADFGIACRTDDKNDVGCLRGCIPYFPPRYIEHLATGSTEVVYKDTSGDFWAFGLMLHSMEHGEMPPIYEALSDVEASERLTETFNRSFPKWKNAYASLPPPPDKIESIADLAQAILQPESRRISHANAELACDQLLLKCNY